jgi:hypothetical protein
MRSSGCERAGHGVTSGAAPSILRDAEPILG